VELLTVPGCAIERFYLFDKASLVFIVITEASVTMAIIMVILLP